MEDRYLCKARPLGTRKQWVTGFYAVLGEKTVIIVCEPEKFYDVDSGKNSHGNKIVEVIPETVCQCTGLKDKNGNLIWENDIANCMDAECCGYISWNESEAGFYFDVLLEDGRFEEEHIYDYQDCMEVIGNNFDNPELLEVEE